MKDGTQSRDMDRREFSGKKRAKHHEALSFKTSRRGVFRKRSPFPAAPQRRRMIRDADEPAVAINHEPPVASRASRGVPPLDPPRHHADEQAVAPALRPSEKSTGGEL